MEAVAWPLREAVSIAADRQARRPGTMKSEKRNGTPNWRELAFYSAIATAITVVNITLTSLLFF
jgi:hypothetical protein